MATTRRLAAVMFTDMVGYSTLAQTDEAESLHLLQEQEELVRPLLSRYHGREVKSTGDGLLIEFLSAREATQCAVEIQQRIHERNAQGGTTPLRLRIGIHLGDVEGRGDDIFGDAVNIASRIESVAEPGGVCLSSQVFAQIHNKVPFNLQKLEPRSLKGIQVAVEVYRVLLPWQTPEPESPGSGPTRLAVLPFANISPDPKDEYFADGLTEELITVLSGLEDLQVIARTSVSQYKSTTKPISMIGAELGVTTVLEGSVRKAGDQLRVTVQLIDVAKQAHTWASSFDRKLEDVFAVQAEIAQHVAQSLRLKIHPGQAARLRAKTSIPPESYLAYLKGRTLMHAISAAAFGDVRSSIDEATRLDPENSAVYAVLSEIREETPEYIIASIAKKLLPEARRQFETAIRLDSENAAAYAGLSDALYAVSEEALGLWAADASSPGDPFLRASSILDEARTLAQKAISIDPDLAEGHASLGHLLFSGRGRPDFNKAEEELKLALSLNPSYSAARTWYAELLYDDDRREDALAQLTLAEELDPESFSTRVNLAMYLVGITPTLSLKDGYLAIYYALTGQKGKAAKTLERLSALNEAATGKSQLMAVAYAYLGEIDLCLTNLRKALSLQKANAPWWRDAPKLDVLRADPRFQELLANSDSS